MGREKKFPQGQRSPTTHPPGNQEKFINSIKLQNLNKLRSQHNISKRYIIHQNPDTKVPYVTAKNELATKLSIREEH